MGEAKTTPETLCPSIPLLSRLSIQKLSLMLRLCILTFEGSKGKKKAEKTRGKTVFGEQAKL